MIYDLSPVFLCFMIAHEYSQPEHFLNWLPRIWMKTPRNFAGQFVKKVILFECAVCSSFWVGSIYHSLVYGFGFETFMFGILSSFGAYLLKNIGIKLGWI